MKRASNVVREWRAGRPLSACLRSVCGHGDGGLIDAKWKSDGGSRIIARGTSGQLQKAVFPVREPAGRVLFCTFCAQRADLPRSRPKTHAILEPSRSMLRSTIYHRYLYDRS